MTDEQLDQYDNYEQFLEAQQQTEPQEPVNTEETNPESEHTGSETEGEVTQADMTDSEFREFLTSQFRANHKDVQVTDPHDIRRLMQYGMNFHKKMAELAPHRKILKALEQNGLTDESKVNFAIELMQGKKEAIAQLLKQHNVDTYDLPDLEETPYVTGDYIPSQQSIDFDEVVSELKQSQHGSNVIEYLKGLDADSFHQVYTNPIMAQTLAVHAETGLMQDALAKLETERALGHVPPNVNDIDAYAHVAQHLEQTNPEKYYPQRKQQKVVGNNLGKQQNQPQSNQAKMNATIPNNQQPVQQTQQSYSGWDLLTNASDEELSKYDNWEQFLQANNLNFS